MLVCSVLMGRDLNDLNAKKGLDINERNFYSFEQENLPFDFKPKFEFKEI